MVSYRLVKGNGINHSWFMSKHNTSLRHESRIMFSISTHPFKSLTVFASFTLWSHYRLLIVLLLWVACLVLSSCSISKWFVCYFWLMCCHCVLFQNVLFVMFNWSFIIVILVHLLNQNNPVFTIIILLCLKLESICHSR